MELEFRATKAFDDDLKGLDQTRRDRVKRGINRRGQLAITDRRAFPKGLMQPGVRKLADGLDSSLYVLKVGSDLRVVFALDDDPIFGRTIVTLFRVVAHDQLAAAYRDTALALYGEGLLDGQEESAQAGRGTRRPTTAAATDKAPPRRVRGHSRGAEDSANR